MAAAPASSKPSDPTGVPDPAATADPAAIAHAQEAANKEICAKHALESIPETGRCTHGPDPAPPGVDINKDVKPVSRSAAAEGGPLTTPFTGVTSFECDGDGVSGARTQVLYIHASDTPDRLSTYKSSIQSWASEADLIYRSSAAETGGSRHIRFVQDSSCAPTVLDVTVSPTGDGDFGNTISEVEALGFGRSDRVYMMFVDANVYCGVGTLSGDDSTSQNNWNNIGPSYGRIDAGCWSGWVAAHEHMHNLGGVQDSAPHSTGAGHCFDEYDVMCYADSPTSPPLQVLCSDQARDKTLFDCNHDDYFSTNPAPSNYLATHWNAANNQFLVGGSVAPACPDQALEPDNTSQTARPFSVGTVVTRAFCLSGDLDWVTFQGVANRAYQIEISGPNSTTDPAIQLYEGNARTMLGSDTSDAAPVRINYTPHTSGTYYVKVYDRWTNPPSVNKTYNLSITSQSTLGSAVSGSGYNGLGQLASDPALVLNNLLPVLANVASTYQVSAGYMHSLVLKDNGTVGAWGWNAYGQLGDGTTIDRHSQVMVQGLTSVSRLSAGLLHNLAVRSDGTVWAWGWNAFGQLGDGTAIDRATPVQVQGLHDIVDVSAGAIHNLALRSDGTVWAWGWNGLGALGDGTVTSRSVPIQVPGLNAESVGAGLYHSVAALKDGTVKAWGWNGVGQLGDGTTTERHAPATVQGLSNVNRVSAGFLHSIALKDDGTVWAWGSNSLMQAGGATDRLAPGPVMCSSDPSCPRQTGTGILSHVVSLSAGGYHSLALTDTGRVWAWGWNYFGQLGTGNSSDSASAVLSAAGTALDVAGGFIHSLYRTQ
jgi:alpha-tubulin suppressor-like RCC1 family protein